MHKVLDFGAHNSNQLKEFFVASPTNTVLVTDMMGIESLKRDGLENHRRSFEIIARYADRVIVLLPSGIAARLPPDRHRFPDNLIDRSATSGFPAFCAATLGNNAPHVLAKIAENQAKARHFADGVSANIGVFREAITGMLGSFPPAILADLRSGRMAAADPSVLRHIRTNGALIAEGQFAKLFPGQPMPPSDELFHWLPFRYSVALYAIGFRWAVIGGHDSAKAATLRNDGIDMFYVAYGSAFDGVISRDAKLLEMVDLVAAALKQA